MITIRYIHQLRTRRLRTKGRIFCLIGFILALTALLDYPWRLFVPGRLLFRARLAARP